jgi:hypothetical protein
MAFIVDFEQKFNEPLNFINYETPDIQRLIDDEHIKKIIDFQENFYLLHGKYCISGIISVAKAEKTYLVDGQHRIAAYAYLMKIHPERSLLINVNIYHYDGNGANLDLIYKYVNENKPNDITLLSVDTYKILNELEKYFAVHFKEYLKTSKNPRKPHINISNLKSYIIDKKIIEKLNEKLKTITFKNLLDKILALNTFYSSLPAEQYKKWGVDNVDETIHGIESKSCRLYLGLYNQFEWIDRIAECVEFHKIPHISNSYRPHVTETLKLAVWDSELLNGNCYCCNRKITFSTFECGHIIPLVYGGETTVANLKKICSKCNRDMGTMNLEEYKKLIEKQLK